MPKLVQTQQAIKALSKAGKANYPRLRKAISELAHNPNSKTNNIKSLKGSDEFRLRVGDWRIIFLQKDDSIIITDVRKRDEATYKRR